MLNRRTLIYVYVSGTHRHTHTHTGIDMPVWKGFQDARKERKHQLLQYIVDNTKNGDLEVSQLVALFSWQWGFKPKKIKEYIEELRSLGAIIGSKTVKPTKFATKLLEK